MVVKLFGAIDIIIAVLLFLSTRFDFISPKIIIAVAVYILVKSLIFVLSKDIASMIEILIGAVIIASFYFEVSNTAFYIIVAYFAIKGLLSLLPN